MSLRRFADSMLISIPAAGWRIDYVYRFSHAGGAVATTTTTTSTTSTTTKRAKLEQRADSIHSY